MSEVKEEYTRETYPSFGKKYNGEKAIISLTSWRARINTVSKTLFSLLKQCPGFHIVLVLSEEEFPKMMDELPENLKLFAKNELIEILWVYKNYKSFKKVLFTMDKYHDVPVISADDDCNYVKNYAEELYQTYLKFPNDCIAYRKSRIPFCLCGPATLYTPVLYNTFITKFRAQKITNFQDDGFFANVLKEMNKKPIALYDKFPCYFHDEIRPLTGSMNHREWISAQSF
jgi:hypothetical protein